MRKFLLAGLLLVLAGCSSIEKKIDRYGIDSTAKEILADFHPDKLSELQNFIQTFSLDQYTVSGRIITNIAVKPLRKWHLKKKNLIYEKWILPSSFHYDAELNQAVYYVIRQGPIENSKIILWVPGKGVSDFAFHFIKHFFQAEIQNGYNIVIYIPAYHMERTQKGKKSGDGFFTSSVIRNTENILYSARELGEMINYLKYKKVRSISGWAGSMGVSMLLLANGGHEKFEHCTVMIPVLDYNTVFLMPSLLDRYSQYGISSQLISQANSLISPITYKLQTEPAVFQILYGKYDQLNPTNTIRKYAEENHVSNLIMYPRSHGTILLGRKIYKDYARFLKFLPQ